MNVIAKVENRLKKNTIRQIARDRIPECRMSPDACELLALHLRAECEEIVKTAWTYAKHANRITINVQDMTLAIRQRLKPID
jgi:histone H3/H4